MNLDMKFKDNLRKQRTKAQLSQEDLAEKMSVSRQTISKWENGCTYPSTEHVSRLGKIFGCSIDNLIDNETSDGIGEKSQLPATIGHDGRDKRFVCWAVGLVFCLIGVLFGFWFGSCGDVKIGNSGTIVFDELVKDKIDNIVGIDGYEVEKMVGYGVTKEKRFYVKCDLSDKSGDPCSAIVYFCKDAEALVYECQYLEDADYIPEGEYYKLG